MQIEITSYWIKSFSLITAILSIILTTTPWVSSPIRTSTIANNTRLRNMRDYSKLWMHQSRISLIFLEFKAKLTGLTTLLEDLIARVKIDLWLWDRIRKRRELRQQSAKIIGNISRIRASTILSTTIPISILIG